MYHNLADDLNFELTVVSVLVHNVRVGSVLQEDAQNGRVVSFNGHVEYSALVVVHIADLCTRQQLETGHWDNNNNIMLVYCRC